MAKFVIAGQADCPYYAKVELLADSLQSKLADFHVHKIVKTPEEWKPWLQQLCGDNGWSHGRSPIIWRELVDRGGKGLLIGGHNDFMEYARSYYGMTSDMLSQMMKNIAAENLAVTQEQREEEEIIRRQSKPLHVCVVNAARSPAYHVLPSLVNGEILREEEIALHLHDSEANLEKLRGLEMEVFDLSYPFLKEISVTTDLLTAFQNAHVAIVFDDFDQGGKEDAIGDMEAKVSFYKRVAEAINQTANKDIRVLVAGTGPLNSLVSILIDHTPSIPKQNIAAVAQVKERQAKSLLAKRLAVNSAGVCDVIVWGNVGGTTYTDVSRARVHGYDGAIWGPPSYSCSVSEMVHDNKWLEVEFLEQLQSRSNTTQESLQHAADLSMAAAISNTLGYWWNGSPEGQLFSLAVCSEGYYNVPEGVVFSFPVIFHKGSWEVVQDIDMNEDMRVMLSSITAQLVEEKDLLLHPTNANHEKLLKVFGVTPDVSQPSSIKLDKIMEETEKSSSEDTPEAVAIVNAGDETTPEAPVVTAADAGEEAVTS
ncbi:putative malate dehydrogenase 1B [Branchiostoma lanceolatum]|uniref:putative malate dehydrogenase 1B n=1 Tax=Branchiostoma lanceolatum TaxID=7740 RepID=UPI003452AF76